MENQDLVAEIDSTSTEDTIEIVENPKLDNVQVMGKKVSEKMETCEIDLVLDVENVDDETH